MPKQLSTARRTSIAGLLAATSLVMALSGCATYDVTAPADARADAPANAKNDDAKNGDAKGGKGANASDVDCRKAKCVALTFDAGPSENTNRLLDILKKEHAHATFFMLGKNHIAERPAEVKRIDAEGHELANHTWSHKILTDIEPAEAK